MLLPQQDFKKQLINPFHPPTTHPRSSAFNTAANQLLIINKQGCNKMLTQIKPQRNYRKNHQNQSFIEELENALKAAIEKGLQLAIFNSCDGLGLGRQLAQLHIPQIIVMREPVPDTVAQEFLKNFLGLFANGKSLYVSVRQAREMLQSMEDKFPCASWLPVIYQNQAEVPKTWQEFGYNNRPKFEDLLARLQEAIEAETALTAEDETDALEQVRLLRELGASPPEESKRLVKLAIRMLRGIIGDRPEATMMAEALDNLLFVYLFPGG